MSCRSPPAGCSTPACSTHRPQSHRCRWPVTSATLQETPVAGKGGRHVPRSAQYEAHGPCMEQSVDPAVRRPVLAHILGVPDVPEIGRGWGQSRPLEDATHALVALVCSEDIESVRILGKHALHVLSGERRTAGGLQCAGAWRCAESVDRAPGS